jgi:hypothetical protein
MLTFGYLVKFIFQNNKLELNRLVMLKKISEKLRQEKEVDYHVFEVIFLVIAFLSVAE